MSSGGREPAGPRHEPACIVGTIQSQAPTFVLCGTRDKSSLYFLHPKRS
jgi:hypothetical protein